MWMRGRGSIATAVCAAALISAAGVAHAEALRPAPEITFTTRDAFAPGLNQWGMQATRRTMEFDSRKGRWGLKLNMEQAGARSLPYTDVQAGAYYKVTPSLRVGGAFTVPSLNDPTAQTALPVERAPRVRLETAFKF